jgi:hypothetical protein
MRCCLERGDRGERLRGTLAAPFEPAAVVNADAWPAHEPHIEEGNRSAPPCTAVESREALRRDAFSRPERANLVCWPTSNSRQSRLGTPSMQRPANRAASQSAVTRCFHRTKCLGGDCCIAEHRGKWGVEVAGPPASAQFGRFARGNGSLPRARIYYKTNLLIVTVAEHASISADRALQRPVKIGARGAVWAQPSSQMRGSGRLPRAVRDEADDATDGIHARYAIAQRNRLRL